MSQSKITNEPIHLNIATAANFRSTLEHLLVVYKNQQPTEPPLSINLISGSTGILYQQIIRGAPFDIYFSADSLRPQLLIENNFSSKAWVFHYAYGEIVLAVKSKVAQAAKFNCSNTQALTASDLDGVRKLLLQTDKIVIANPKIAPYGTAAKEFLSAVYSKPIDSKQLKIAQAKNSIHAQQLFETTDIAIGIFSKSQMPKLPTVTHSVKGRSIYCPISAVLYNDIAQVAAIVKRKGRIIRSTQAAIAFKNFIQSKAAAEIIQENGYTPANNF